MLISSEEKFLIDVLFNNTKILKVDVDKLSLDKIIKIASSHLVLPLLYDRIIEKIYQNISIKNLWNI